MRKLLVWTWILTSAFVACASDEDGGDSAGDGGVDDDFSDDDAAADDDSGTDDDDGGDHDVDASNGDWTDFAFDVSLGDLVTIEATGTATLSDDSDPNGPDGTGDSCGVGCTAPTLPRGALIGRVGEAGTPFFVGASYDGVGAANGTLHLIVNDDDYADNGGGFDVTISVEPGGDTVPASCRDENFILQIIDVDFGALAGFGEDEQPDNILGPPAGKGDYASQASQKELLSLGEGGRITVKMAREIVDGPGPDFVVFENVLYWGGDPLNAYTDTALVEVSADGQTWKRFPFDFVAEGPTGPQGLPDTVPENFIGFAGVTPTYANCDPNGDGDFADMVDPLDLSVSGGDPFDLADVGLSNASYVRLIDTGHIERAPGTEVYDDDGDLVSDGGNLLPAYQGIQGFDLDAIGVIHGGDVLEPDA